jgi:small-conductance mechanosensitive channel
MDISQPAEHLKNIMDFTVMEIKGYKFNISSILIIIGVYIVTRVFLYLIKRIILRKGDRQDKVTGRHYSLFLLSKYFIWFIAFGIMLDSVGIKLTFLIASSAALLVGLGLGLQEIFKDFVSGILLLIEQSVSIGDVMEVDGLIGRVTEMNLRTSKVQTREGIYMIIPNHKFINEKVINWSHNAFAVRFYIAVGVSYKSDVELVKKILEECAKDHKEIIRNEAGKEPFVRLIDFGNSSIDFQLLFWSENIFFIENTKSELRFLIRKKFQENNIEIPFPQRDLYLKQMPDSLKTEKL